MESQPAGKAGRHKAKNKKAPAKTKTPKKRKSDGPTCSMFLAELTRKLAYKKKQDEESETSNKNIVYAIIDTISNAMPVTMSKKTIERDSPTNMESLQKLAPELLPNDTVEILSALPQQQEELMVDESDAGGKMPRMPIIVSDMMKPPVKVKEPVPMHDMAINTGGDHDVASEISKHVNTLRKISLIAEEFNQKTAKNLKEIVDSVQEDLVKKLEQIKAEQKAKEAALAEQARMAVDQVTGYTA